MMSKKSQEPTVFHLILCVLFVSLSIYAWVRSGCLGFPECYLCRAFIPDCYLKRPYVQSTTTTADFFRLMNLNNFTFLINNLVCENSDLIILVLVHSNPKNFEKRKTIRNTWGKISDKLKILFLMGLTDSMELQDQLHKENDKNRDLLQGNFLDSYRNLTYKHVMALKWTKYFCPNTKYLLKTDDDVFMNSPGLLKYVQDAPKTRLMRCLPIFEGRAKRSSRSKWKVSCSEYQFRFYPPFCQGFIILYSPDVVATLYEKAQMASYFWIDDVFVTGILGSLANYKPSSFGELMLEPEAVHKFIHKDIDTFSNLLGSYNLKEDDIELLWKKTSKAEKNFIL